MSQDAFKSMYIGGYKSNPNLLRAKNYNYALKDMNVTATEVDWVAKGAVTPVKNQGQCGSCWSFSTTGAIEGAFKIAGNPLTSFSEEELVECDNSQHGGSDGGCNGGLMDNAFNWVSQNGLCTEDSYPYNSGSGSAGSCRMSSCTPVATLTGHVDVPDEDAMVPALTIGPVSVAIQADTSTFQLYKGGVLDDAKCGEQLDHGVLAVGFGTDSGKDYYKVKNSWGPGWGESGYIRMVRGKDQCGIAKSASYPTGVKKSDSPAPAPGPSPSPSSSGCSTCIGESKDWCFKDQQCHSVGSIFNPCADSQCVSSALLSGCSCKSCDDTACQQS